MRGPPACREPGMEVSDAGGVVEGVKRLAQFPDGMACDDTPSRGFGLFESLATLHTSRG
jgi:hypothetical protein